MSWKGVPKKENYFPLFAEDWNLLVDAVDELYYMLQTLPAAPAGVLVGGYLYGNLLPALDLYYSLGDPEHRFLNVWAKNIYADPVWTTALYAGTVSADSVLVQGKPVLKDGDPIYVADLLPQAQETLKSVIAGTATTSYVADFLSQAQSTLKSIIAGTPVTAYVADLLPQAQDTLKNVLINSVLARDLWETVPLLIQFEAGDGALEVYSPPFKYRAVVRGWYAVSTGAGGSAQLRGAYSLTPVALIPLSVPSISVSDIFLRLYYDEPLLLYYSGVTLGSYLQVLLNVLNEWTGVSVIDPSGLDPNDPLWTPSDGWTYVYRFKGAEEITQMFNWPGSYVKVENGVLKYNVPPQGMDGSERYITGQSWKRAAACIKLKIIEAKQNYSNIIYFNPAFTPDREVGVGFDLVAGSTSVKITDWYPWPGTSYDFTPPDDWFVIVVDNTPDQTPYIRIYDKNKNLLFERVLTLNATPWIYEDLFFEVHNDTDYGTWNIEIDWIALKY